MTAAMIAQAALESEGIAFMGFGLFVIGLIIFYEYIIRRWSWIPRKRHNRKFYERF